MILSEILSELFESFFYTVYRFVDDDSILFVYEWLQYRLSSLLHREKSKIQILMTVYPTRDQCREDCRSSWDRHYRDTFSYSTTYEHESWITDSGCSSIGDEGYMLPLLEKLDDALHLRESRMWVERQETSTIFYIIVSEKLPRHTGIFAGDIVCFFQCTKGSQSYILEVTDGSRDDTEVSWWWNGHDNQLVVAIVLSVVSVPVYP